MRTVGILTLAAAVIIAGAVAGSGVYLFAPRGVAGQCVTSQTGMTGAIVNATMSPPSGVLGDSTLIIDFRNEGGCPMGDALIVDSHPLLSASGPFTLTYNGKPVDWNNTVPSGGEAVGEMSLTNVTTTSSFVMNLVVVFEPPQAPEVVTLPVEAQ